MEFTTKQVSSSEDKAMINRWWNSFGHPGLPEDCYPELSIIVYFKGKPICAGCAYLTDSTVMYFDNYISNQDSDKNVRDAALDELTRALLKGAKASGYKYWVANAKKKCVADRTIKFKRTQLGEGHYWFTGEI